ncbi:hypothetical protein ABZZ17_09320 [Streptomyces sp. NPDC006512]|uniref:hypothetical protein n=1 Tax=Streptomyces sp. NPDC006512 TaxID=3154307 RepID=UPI0033AC787C
MGKRLRLGAVIAVFAAVLAFGPAPATAAPAPAVVEQTRWLTNAPNSGMAPVSMHRDIYLVAATYTWQVYTCQDGYTCIDGGRSIALNSGWYSWDCTLTPQDGYYSENCSLETPGSPRATYGKAITLDSSAHYDIGSKLQAR